MGTEHSPPKDASVKKPATASVDKRDHSGGRRRRIIVIAIWIVCGILAFQGILPWQSSDLWSTGRAIGAIEPPLLVISREANHYLDAAGCSLFDPCLNPVRLVPEATRYAFAYYRSRIQLAPVWAIALSIILDLAAIVLTALAVLGFIVDGLKKIRLPLTVLLLVAAASLMAAIPAKVWCYVTRFPRTIVRSIRRDRLLHDLRAMKWADPLYLFIIGLLFLASCCFFQPFNTVESLIIGLGLGSVGWTIAPALPENWGHKIRSTPPDVVWIMAAGVYSSARFAEDCFLFVGILGIFMVVGLMLLIVIIPGPIVEWIERLRIVSEAPKMFRELRVWFIGK